MKENDKPRPGGRSLTASENPPCREKKDFVDPTKPKNFKVLIFVNNRLRYTRVDVAPSLSLSA
jgi:hypothetical protein